MTKLKTLAGKSFGKNAYPDKRRINLYEQEVSGLAIIMELVIFALFLVALSLFVRVGIVLPMQKAERAEELYTATANQLADLKEANTAMDAVSLEYAHYGSSFLMAEESAIPDRVAIMDTMQTEIFPLCETVTNASISGDTLSLSCVLPKGTILRNLIEKIEEDPSVSYVSVSLEGTPDDESEETAELLAATKSVHADMTVTFKLPTESGDES